MSKNEFTKGAINVDKWTIYAGLPTEKPAVICRVVPWDASGCREEDTQNVELIVAAFEAATALDALGYDAIAVLKALPAIVVKLVQIQNVVNCPPDTWYEPLTP